MYLRFSLLYRIAIIWWLSTSNQLAWANPLLAVIVNRPPVAPSLAKTLDEDTSVKITLVAMDADNDKLAYKLVTVPISGTVSLAGNIATYTPKANFNGQDSFTFKANDGKVDSAAATINLTVKAVNDAPVASTQTLTLTEDTVSKVTLIATDADNDKLTYKLATTPTNGTVALVGNIATYTPKTNFNGQDSFTFKANDGKVDSAAATINLTVKAVNDAPAASTQTLTLTEDTVSKVTLIATDADNDKLTYKLATMPSNGTVALVGNIATYTPKANFTGQDSFTFKANDGKVDSAAATVKLVVNPVNDAPLASPQTVTLNEDKVAKITLTATDVDKDNLTYKLDKMPVNGVVTLVGNIATYTPKTNFNGQDSFTFKANDGKVDSATATVSLIVNPVNDAPLASPQTITLNEDTITNIPLPATDIDNEPLKFSIDQETEHGVLSVNNNIATFTPDPNYNGTDSFTFKASDKVSSSATVKISLIINSINDAPRADLRPAVADWGLDPWQRVTSTPDVAPLAGHRLKFIAAGGHRTLVQKADGTLFQWGCTHINYAADVQDECVYGQIPKGLNNLKDVSVGIGHTLAITSDNKVVAWGHNEEGQLNVPVGLSDVKKVIANAHNSFALTNSGSVIAWGSNATHSLDIPSTLKFTKVKDLGFYCGVAVALTTDNRVVTWGNPYANSGCTYPSLDFTNIKYLTSQEFGGIAAVKNDGTVTATTPAPTGLNNVKSLTIGHYGSFLALKNDGTVVEWGAWSDTYPIPSGLKNVKAITSGFQHFAALLSDDSIVIWGDKTAGQASIVGKTTDLLGVKAISAGPFYSLALKGDGTVVGWGDDTNYAGITNIPTGLANVKAIAAGYEHALALKQDGTVSAWGATEQEAINVPKGLTSVKAIAAGASTNNGFSVALKSDGSTVTWGSFYSNGCENLVGVKAITATITGNISGGCTALLNDGTLANTSPIIKNIKAAADNCLVLLRNGTVQAICGNTNVPAGLKGVKAITAGLTNSMALKNDGSLVTWGIAQTQIPIPAGLKNVLAIDAKQDHKVALYLKEAPFSGSTFKNQSVQIPLPGWDADGDTLTYNLGRPTHGTVVLNGNGLITYTPTSGYVGLDSFSLTVSDGKTTSLPTIIGIAVAAP